MARIVVVGGSVAGLSAALLMARRGHAVTVLERDPHGLPTHPDQAWDGWRRPGLPHLRQLHIFNALGRRTLLDHLPDVYAAWLEAGAFETPLLPGDPDVVRVNCRRSTFEWVLRTAVCRQPGVTVAPNACARAFTQQDRRVTAVTTTDGASFPADLVVDASGRLGLAARTVAGVQTTTRPCGLRAATRWYRVTRGDVPAQAGTDLGYTSCVLVPADGGLFSVTFGYQRADRALRRLDTPAGFERGAARVDAVADAISRTNAEPASDVLPRPDSPNRLSHIPDGTVAGLVLVGDAAIVTNPGYGRGIGLALAHAARLADTVDRTEADPAETTDHLEAVTAAEHAPWFHAAAASDRVRRAIASRARAGEPLTEIGGPGDDPDVRFARALPRATLADPAVNRAFLRTWHLLDPPSTLWGDPAIRARVDEIAATHAPTPPGGPDHATMVSLLAE